MSYYNNTITYFNAEHPIQWAVSDKYASANICACSRFRNFWYKKEIRFVIGFGANIFICRLKLIFQSFVIPSIIIIIIIIIVIVIIIIIIIITDLFQFGLWHVVHKMQVLND